MAQQLQREEAAQKAMETSNIFHPVEAALSSVEDTTNQQAEQAETGRIESLLQILKGNTKSPLWSRKRVPLAFVVIYGVVFLGLMVSPLTTPPSLTGLIVMSILAVPPFLALFAYSRKNLKAIEEITQSEDVRAVGPLLDCLEEFKNPPNFRAYEAIQIQKAIQAALRRLVPRMETSDIDQLTPNQITCIYETLKGYDKETPYFDRHLSISLTIKYLEILTRVGESRILPYLERWAKGGGPGERYSRIRVAAQDCLILLPERIRELEMQGTLLRASNATNIPSETLLRPSVEMGTTDPKQLLRPTDNTQDDGKREA